MVELNNKYKIGKRRFGLINWIGFYSLYKKETLRFLIVFGQTIVGPVLTGILFLIVISIAWGDERGEVLGLPFIEFLAPGLISMQVIQQAFSHSSSSILMGKVMGNIVDLIGSPLSAVEVTLAIVLASVTRSLIICLVSIICFNLLVDVNVLNYYYFFTYLFFSSFLMGSLGFIAGMWAEKFDNMATITNFIIVPLSFLSGTFYSIDRLPDILKEISIYNPFFHMIDGLRFSMIGISDGSTIFGLLYLLSFSLILWSIAYYLYKKGYKIKS
jgi:ABC-2 type transport system permease protein